MDQLRKGACLPRNFTLSAINYQLSAISYQLPVRRSRGEGGSTLNSQLSTLQLLSHFLKLLTDYRAVKAIDGDACLAVARRRRVKPVSLFVFELSRV